MNFKIQNLSAILFLMGTSIFSTTAFAQCDGLEGGREIVGAWRGASGEGNPILLAANSDGIAQSSVVSEVSLSLRPNVLTPGQGAWRQVGDRTFEVTIYGFMYSISTGKYQAYLRAKSRLTVSSDCNSMTGSDKVEIFTPNNTLLFSVPEGATSYIRTRPEAFD